MQQTVYKCDECEKEIGLNIHISLRFAQNSGIAVPPVSEKIDSGNRYWHTTPSLQGRFVHFCSAKCLKIYFDDLIFIAKNENKPKKK